MCSWKQMAYLLWKIKKCISCFKNVFIIRIPKAAQLPCPWDTSARQYIPSNVFCLQAPARKNKCEDSSVVPDFCPALNESLLEFLKISFIVDFSIKDLNYLVTWAETDLVKAAACVHRAVKYLCYKVPAELWIVHLPALKTWPWPPWFHFSTSLLCSVIYEISNSHAPCADLNPQMI